MNYENIFLSEEEQQKQIEIDNIKTNGLIGLTLPTIEQIESLDIFEKYGTMAAITDFSLALGGYVLNNNFTNEGNRLENRTGWYWTKSSIDNDVRAVNYYGTEFWTGVDDRDGGCRPALPFSSISKISSNIVREGNGVEVEYGEYPQWVCSKELNEELEKLYLNNKLNKTGKIYTTDSVHYDEYDKDFYPQKHIEYEYNGKKYVRVLVNSYYDGNEITFSNGEEYKDGDYVWISVSPVKWLVDEESDTAITKNIIVAGIQFNLERNYTEDNFDEMNIKKFLDNYLSKEIISGIVNSRNASEVINDIIFNNDMEKSELEFIRSLISKKKEQTIEEMIQKGIKEMNSALSNLDDYQKKLRK